jgi:hypothetical protein
MGFLGGTAEICLERVLADIGGE